jgi:prepilin-type N-terminal cleavage/methylation domain-containing protein/prepilin-type processing-associated H-X9-DG protein
VGDTRRPGFTLLELLISTAVVCALIVILLPALATARTSNRRALCAGNQRLLGQTWFNLLDTNDGRFPVVYAQPAWLYVGVRFPSAGGAPFLDLDRPLNRYLPSMGAAGEALFHCPADRGITDAGGQVGTGSRSAYEAYGTSYRANPRLLAPRPGGDAPSLGLRRADILAAPSRLVVMGDPLWHEIRESTGLHAAWHGAANAGNMLFLDGSVRFVTIEPKPKVGPAVFEPLSPDLAFPRD